MKNRNLTLLMDYYALTMANGYFENGLKDEMVYYDMFFLERCLIKVAMSSLQD